MSNKTTTVRARLEPALKEETELILEQLGLSTTEAIRIFFRQIKLQRGMPFDLKLPNEDTVRAIEEAQKGNQLTSYNSPEKLFDELDI